MSSSLANYTKQQLKAINATESRVAVIAGVGTGKTHTIIGRVNKVLNDGANPSKIVIVTLTNLAASVLKERLVVSGKGIKAGTLHSYINGILYKHNLSPYKEIQTGNFSAIFNIFAQNHQYIEIPPIDYLFLDEAQDIDGLIYKTIRLLQAKNIWCVGDPLQSIYGFSGSEQYYVKNIVNNPNYTKYSLTIGFRCGGQILQYAQKILHPFLINQSSLIISNKPNDGVVSKIKTLDFINYLKTIKDYSDWAILCRSNNMLGKMQAILRQEKIPFISYKPSELDYVEYNGFNEGNWLKLLTIHSSKGNEFKNVAVWGGNCSSMEESMVWYVGCTRCFHKLFILKGSLVNYNLKVESKLKTLSFKILRQKPLKRIPKYHIKVDIP